mgnify:CR=1 FL=1
MTQEPPPPRCVQWIAAEGEGRGPPSLAPGQQRRRRKPPRPRRLDREESILGDDRVPCMVRQGSCNVVVVAAAGSTEEEAFLREPSYR